MRTLAASPSSGEFEILRALDLARGRDGNYVPVEKLKRRMPTRVTAATVISVLTGESGSYVQTDGTGGYRLTASGVTRSRANKPRRWIEVT